MAEPKTKKIATKTTTPKKQKKNTTRGFDINERYTKKSDLEHVLLRPDTYVGGTDKVEKEDWVVVTSQPQNNEAGGEVLAAEEEAKEHFSIAKRRISVSPALCKILDEILVNARDHSVRDSTCNRIRVNFDRTDGSISVENSGEGIAVEIHEEGCYLPELIFGHFKTGENFSDGEQKIVGGRNGFGSKCLEKNILVPLWSGKYKKAVDITMDDQLIGDDGTVRHIKKIIRGTGKLYEITQGRKGEIYKVNDQHVLTLHMPDHKNIFWNSTKKGWTVLWWDRIDTKIRAKTEHVENQIEECPECGQHLSGHLKRHYSRMHNGLKVPTKTRKPVAPTVTVTPDNITPEMIAAKKRLEDYCENIPDDSVFDMCIEDYMSLDATTRSRLAGIRADCVQWPKKKVILDPYVLGLWLGDEYCDGDNDPVIISYLTEWCGCVIDRVSSLLNIDNGNNPLKQQLQRYNLIQNKHIPIDYIMNDKETRLKVLAGLIDTDGTVQREGTRIKITQGLIHKQLADDITFLARSLGFNCNTTIRNASWTYQGVKKTGQAYCLNITGDGIGDIPTLLPMKKCKNNVGKRCDSGKSTGQLKVKEIDEGEYVGFEIDGNQRFAVNDFTVTHNCSNAFSNRFEVDTVDSHTKQRYVQVWENNMSVRHEPVITKCTKAPYTKITFIPDYKRFGGSEGMEQDFVMLAKRRVYDLAACTRPEVLIYLDGEKLPVRNFEKYMNMYLGESKSDAPRLFLTIPNEPPATEAAAAQVKSWDIGIALSDDGFKHVSFVNGIATSEGGTHVAYIRDQLVRKLGKIIRDKNPNTDMKPEYIRENMWLFINATVLNPAFSSQTKEQLTTKPENFGFKHNISEEFVQTIEKRLKISKRAVGFAELRQPSVLKRTDGKKKKKIHGILKLEDAKHAGGKLSAQCTLILTEGDSAKTLAMDGLQIIGRDFYGVFPLKGKPLNTRNATNDQLANNEEYIALKKIIGLEEGRVYNDASELRYGCVMLMTDQDLDGYHIKGININNLFDRFPSLLMIPGFIKCFVTPIVKLQPVGGGKSKLKEKLFFNMSEFEAYRKTNPTAMKGMKARYLKGLGTSETEEAREYFADFKRFVKEYVPRDKTLQECKDLFEHAFSQTFADWRKQWLSVYDENKVYDYNQSQFVLEDFIDRELKHFSIYDNQRSLGHICDGLKISQRKVLWALREMNLWNDTKKVLALSGEVSSKSSYHHGEKSLMDTMIGMAQTFVASNNVNNLYPSGQFGTRLRNGQDAADARYIYTKLTDITRYIFRAEDDPVLRYEIDDEGKQIEPKYFAPIVANVLFNGCDGIGTGYSTTVLKYHPVEVIDAHISVLKGQTLEANSLMPWYRGFRGKIEKSVTSKGLLCYISYGIFERTGDTTVSVTELPVGQAFDAYKEFLESHLVENAEGKNTDKSKYFIKDYESETFPTKCNFTITFADKLALDETFENPSGPKGILKKLKLTSTLSSRNMYLFNEQGAIVKYETPEDIIKQYYPVRLDLYSQRIAYQLQELKNKIGLLDRKRRFIELVIAGVIETRKRTKQDVAAQIRQHNLVDPDEPVDDDDTSLTPNMKALLKISLYDMTEEEVAKFIGKIKQLEEEYKHLEAMTPESVWLQELEELRVRMEPFLKETSSSSDNLPHPKKTVAAPAKKKVAIKKK
jgi:DNA topoisomerase-2